jgi:hypothetical protein
LIPSQAFIYLLITFGVIFFFHHLKEWQDAGKPSSAILRRPRLIRLKIYSILIWVVAICLAVLYRDGLEGSPLHLASYLVATLLGNAGLMLKMIAAELKVNNQ